MTADLAGGRRRSEAAAPAGRAGRRRVWAPRSARSRQALVAWGFALPFMLLFAVFMALPVTASFVMSFTDIRSTDALTPWAVNLVGIKNYVRLLGDPIVRQAALNTGYFVVVCVPLTMACGLAAAVALDKGVTRLRTVLRVGYYLPVVSSIVAISVVWRFLLEPNYGIVNTALARLHIDGPSWLNDPATAMPSLIVMAAWRNLGFLMVIFLAGLQTIPAELGEAAQIDGAGPWRRFRHVTLPMLRPTLLFAAVITGIGYLQFFEEPFVMTRGGPLDSTLSVTYVIYNQFGKGNYDYASAISYVLFAVIAAFTVLQFRLLRPRGLP
jgi:multiple sugar transport system permease protein